MTLPLLLAAAIQPIVPAPALAPSDIDPCGGVADPTHQNPSDRTMTVDDLVAIADIGPAIGEHNARAIGISPDGDRIAFVVKQANSRANAYCQRLLVVSSSGVGEAVELARGGAYLRADFPLRDFSYVRAGWDKPNPPRWSPDGARIAYLRRDGPTTQVWIVDASGVIPSREATALPDDVDDFAWTADGRAFVVATRPGIRAATRAIAEEGTRGYLFDERFSPQFAGHPIPTGPLSREYTLVSLRDGSTRPATEAERALLDPARHDSLPASAHTYREGPDGWSAWLEPKHSDRILSPTRIVIAGPQGQRRVCEDKRCEGVLDMWWSGDDRVLLMQQRTGWARSETALLRWAEGASAPRRIFSTEDLLIGCETLRHELVCGREGAAQPRRLVAIDTRDGAERTIHDTNARLRNMDYGRVQRLRFRNSYGVESFADLVLPPGHREGQRHPLVVVQYSSRGFLRGGTGDEVPIHPLTTRGFAVLSFQRPGLLPEAYKARNEIETHTLIADPWADRRQVLSSLETAIELSIAAGSVDPDRIGISGFSDGGWTVQFALINSDLFKVAAMGTCCADRTAQPLAAGPRFTDHMRAMGYIYFEPGGEQVWQPMSLVLNVDAIQTPILIQASDSEYEGALDVFETFTHRGKPIELFVFPDETHYKWQPAHRRAIYERNIEWFDFWLNRRMNCAPSRSEQYERWLAMAGAPTRNEMRCSASASGGP